MNRRDLDPGEHQQREEMKATFWELIGGKERLGTHLHRGLVARDQVPTANPISNTAGMIVPANTEYQAKPCATAAPQRHGGRQPGHQDRDCGDEHRAVGQCGIHQISALNRRVPRDSGPGHDEVGELEPDDQKAPSPNASRVQM